MTKLIKKYKNRRLYDTEISQYVTVEDLQRYVLEHVSFQVIDRASHKDLTSSTLLQILVEMQTCDSPFLSAEMLRQLIILANHPLSQSFKTMLAQMMHYA